MDFNTKLMFDTEENIKKTLEYLALFDVNVTNATEALRVCVEKCYGSMALALLDDSKGADIHNDDEYVFRMACEKGCLAVVQPLITKGVNVEAGDNYAIKKASENAQLKITEILLASNKINDIKALDEAIAIAKDKSYRLIIEKLTDYKNKKLETNSVSSVEISSETSTSSIM